MMRSNLFIFLFLLSSNAFSQDCTDLKENEEYRLDKNDGPLSKAAIQDQDGLGTCYANATSVALQSALRDNPNLSYLQLAFGRAQSIEVPKTKDRDSAFKTPTQNEVLINGGLVCDTINAAKANGVCKRDDVALEQSLFNGQNGQKDSLFIQKNLINAVSKYYDSIKNTFGVGPGVPKKEIADRIVKFSNYKDAYMSLIKEKQTKFSQEACLRSDTSNFEQALKNLAMKNYSRLKNQYGEYRPIKIPRVIKGKDNPDYTTYFYNSDLLSVYSGGGKNGDEIIVQLTERSSKILKTDYMNNLFSPTPPQDAESALKNALMKNTDKKNFPVIEKMMSELSPEDKAALEKDYKRYTQKNDEDCMQKNALSYFKSDDGLVKDFAGDVCMKNLQNIATLLDQANLKNIDALTNFMNKLPLMSYEEAMSGIVAPDCSDNKKIKIPKNLSCNSTVFNFTSFLKEKVSGNFEDLTKQEEEKIKIEIEENYPSQVAAAQKKYEGKTDPISRLHLSDDLKSLETEKNRRLQPQNIHAIAEAKVPRKMAGDKEQKYWDEYVNNNKKDFNSNAIGLLKNQKQVVPISVCTRMFSDPHAQALRDGTCEQSSADSSYKNVGGYHAVSVIGVRCQKGKLNYLIQNSWGDWDAIKDAKNDDGSQHYEHEYGKAWMNEDELMSNAFDYQKISK